MKKLFVLSVMLLSTLLYGCSDHGSGMYETIPTAAESYVGESETKLVEEEYGTEDPGIPAQDKSPQPAEATLTANNRHYRAATDLPDAEVESYAAQIRQQFLDHDWAAVSSELSYPITISDVTYDNSTEFLDASGSFDSNLDEAFLAALEQEDCAEMFCNWEGIMLGETGQVWISEILDGELHSQGLKIVAVNGMFKKK